MQITQTVYMCVCVCVWLDGCMIEDRHTRTHTVDSILSMLLFEFIRGINFIIENFMHITLRDIYNFDNVLR